MYITCYESKAFVMTKTAAELMAELENNQDYQAMKAKRKQHFSDLEKLYAEDEKVLVSEINKLGYSIESVWDFVNSKNNYLSAVSILIDHLTKQHHPKITSGIARSLAIPELSKDNALWSNLEKIYLQTESDAKIKDPINRGLQESIAIALEVLSTPSRAIRLKNIISNKPNADGIEWLKAKVNSY